VQVIATAGHVDHGKSTLVRALTGMEPDRLAEERRRGLTIELGFAWTTLPSGRRLAFVDVPGHERFVGTMLAGVGPVPAVLFVVAADDGWCAQSAEHLAVLDALGVSQGLLAVTRSDLADPQSALTQARERLRGTSLAGIDAVAVSGRTGQGLTALTAALDQVAAALPVPAADADVRLWVDRAFTITGAGTVVTGTLDAGTIRVGDELRTVHGRARVRGLQTLNEPAAQVSGVARVAVNLRGTDPAAVPRGTPLLTPDAWRFTSVVDVGLDRPVDGGQATLHVGSAAVAARVRPLGERAARLTLARELPLRIGDRALLRDPGRPHAIAGVRVLDVRPPALRRRGAARARAAELAAGVPDAARLLRWHGLLRRSELVAMGCPPPDEPLAGEWLADPGHWAALRERLAAATAAHERDHPLDGGLPVTVAQRVLELPAIEMVAALARPPLRVRHGRVRATDVVSEPVRRAVELIIEDLADRPFQAPKAHWLAERGIDHGVLAAAARAGLVLRLAGGVILPPDAAPRAASCLAALPQPFTASDARRALDTTRRVAIPLLEHLDAAGVTKRIDEAHREVISS